MLQLLFNLNWIQFLQVKDKIEIITLHHHCCRRRRHHLFIMIDIKTTCYVLIWKCVKQVGKLWYVYTLDMLASISIYFYLKWLQKLCNRMTMENSISKSIYKFWPFYTLLFVCVSDFFGFCLQFEFLLSFIVIIIITNTYTTQRHITWMISEYVKYKI